ncbi:DUF4190 domain-containing protein [uncultured Clostridium sp.]|uniref:DUF4190 domain-containing protein n=1 Tax=uncultured Clostridium sp. TaxID=59620 RepID=UPI00262081AD|nr:DUF4190 domain-containing protein [uncultured Clostridium sp.]
MSIAALILSILGFLISLSIFKDLSLILCVLAIVLGIIALAKKKGKIICIISIVLAIFGLIFVFSENNGTTVSSNNTSNNNSNSESTNTETIKTYGLNEEITIKTLSDEYTLVITGIDEMTERNQYSDKEYEQVFLIDYTYKCINSDDSIYISDMNFKIIDKDGEIGGTYPNSTSKNSENITSGITCKSQMVLGVNNKSDKITLQYFDNMFNSKPDAIFELNIAE